MYTARSRFVEVARLLLLVALGVATSAGRSDATPVTASFVLRDVDWTSAAVSGIGGGNGVGGTGTITLAGVGGPVTHAVLYWHGIDNYTLRAAAQVPSDIEAQKGSTHSAHGVPNHTNACDGVYDNPTILFNGVPVTGIALGDATTNCWGDGSSRAFRADVTALVGGNGAYALSGMTTDECDDVNGASLIVTFDDGYSANNRDLVFFEGNDSNFPSGFPGETDGWHATLPGIDFTTGTVSVQLHLADGQDFLAGLDDNSLTFSAVGPTVVVPDALGRYDGDSTPDAGYSRSEALGTPGDLWDVHTFDVSSLFTTSGTYTLSMDGQDPTYDCTGLVLLIMNLEAGSAPVPARTTTWGKLKAAYR
jgi:hypothetical protein